MASRTQDPALRPLVLPPEFEDLAAPIQGDVKVIVSILVERAAGRLMLSRRQTQQLQRSLWNGLVDAVNAEIQPLSANHH
ncbi:hypothetical protein [Planctomyces sp. SH-PL62]|uniref:hypothetical protein n=1 Tax=Planctomyces sp. SH-PL62 TaxID=1636152 RepID=UPI00078C82CF|nr:hypothetical protein [Planctomyces sp. SH-PL62]AMV38681.1 hypothetical protein VT85_14680 [Planctomyces sp. SH-PL62]